MFDRQRIPEDLLRRDDEDENDINFVSAIGTLIGFSLITKEIRDQTFSMHRLVQLSILAWLEQNQRKADYEREALMSLENKLPGRLNHIQFRRKFETLYPHAQAVLQYRFVTVRTITAWASAFHRIIGFDRREGRFNLAQKKSLQAYEKPATF
jgi:hypothetical protein